MTPTTTRAKIRPILFFTTLLALSSVAVAGAQTVPVLTVNAASSQHPISPNVYGIANYGLTAAYAEEIKVPNIRWGGDGTTRYNWEMDSSNAGFDWYFMSGSGTGNPVPGASVDQMIATYKPAGAGALITIPIIPYVNKSSEWACSFPTSVYGAQQSTNPYVHPNGEDCGNGISAAGKQLIDSDIGSNNVANTIALQQSWVQHLVARFGTPAQGGVPFFQLDNEPSGWGNTHRDVEPNGATYPTIVTLGQEYAAMLKREDPTALVLGPSDFTLGGWIGTPSQQNNLFAGEYYLQQMATYDKLHGVRILDYFDEHYYPQFTNAATQLASTRTLWDPTYNGGTWVEQYFFDGPMQLIPRFQGWIAKYYPGTKLAFSEYSIDSGHKLITDAIAEADVLGIFGRQQVDFANMWNTPAPTDPIAYAFRLYRNYDGEGSQFGNTSVSAVSSNQAELSIYAAARSSDGALTVVVLNKTTSPITTKLAIGGFNSKESAEIFSYSNANLKQISSQGSVGLLSNSLTYTYPAYSATVIVVAGSIAKNQLIANGTYTVKSTASALLLQDPDSSRVAGIQMTEGTAEGSANQNWTLAYAGGYYSIRNTASGLYLTDPNNAGETTAALSQEPAKSGECQLWSITGSQGAWVIHNKTTGLVVAVPDSTTAVGTGAVVEKEIGNQGELWSIE